DPKGIAPRHIAYSKLALTLVRNRAGWTTLADITADGLAEALAQLREERGGLSQSTLNRYRAAWKIFTAWCVPKRMPADPLYRMRSYPTDGHETCLRRPLGRDEFEKLLKSTAASEKVRRGFTGRDRAMLYLVAVTTGLRSNELSNLLV